MDGALPLSKRSPWLVALMIAALAAVLPLTLASSVSGGAFGRLLAGAAASLAATGVGAGVTAALRRRSSLPSEGTPSPRSRGILLLAAGAGLLTALAPGGARLWQSAVGGWLTWLSVGLVGERLAAVLLPVALLLVLAAALSRRALRILVLAAAGVLALAVVFVMPPLTDAAARKAAGALWPEARAAAGTEAPELVLLDVEGVERSLADYRGKLILINVWRTW